MKLAPSVGACVVIAAASGVAKLADPGARVPIAGVALVGETGIEDGPEIPSIPRRPRFPASAGFARAAGPGGRVMERKLMLAAVAAAAHLAIVALGALRVDLGTAGAPGRAAARYSALTGAGSAHGFFGPAIEAEPRATFEVTRRDGSAVPASIGPRSSAGAEPVIQGMVTATMLGNRASCRAVAASCAGKIFGQDPEAERVMVRLGAADLPTMDEARRGARPGTRVLYEAWFVPLAGAR